MENESIDGLMSDEIDLEIRHFLMAWEASHQPSFKVFEGVMINLMSDADRYRINRRSCIYLLNALSQNYHRMIVRSDFTIPVRRLLVDPLLPYDVCHASEEVTGFFHSGTSRGLRFPQFYLNKHLFVGRCSRMKRLLKKGCQASVQSSEWDAAVTKYQLWRFL